MGEISTIVFLDAFLEAYILGSGWLRTFHPHMDCMASNLAEDHDNHGGEHQNSEWASVHVEIDGVDGEHQSGAHHRRLGGGTSPLLRNIAFCLTTCGLVAFFVGLCKKLC